MNTTQDHLSIADISDDILILKNGGGALVMQVSAVNFGLLSDREQMAIIAAFAQMLNSLSFTIQIVIISARLNISSYLLLLDKAQKAQTNSLLSQMITQYKEFIKVTIKENEVLDKKFYIIIPLFSLELGLTASKENLQQKIKTVLLPRRDQVMRQLGRVGLNATQLTQQKLIELFYEVYNGEVIEKPVKESVNPADLAVKLKNPTPTTQQTISSNIPQQPNSTPAPPAPFQPPQPVVTQTPIQSGQSAKTHPFVVEELEE